jgi:hypothetical protein
VRPWRDFGRLKIYAESLSSMRLRITGSKQS